jgi:hypothetical protein
MSLTTRTLILVVGIINMELINDLTGERYIIRSVPLEEAKKLRDSGTIFYDYTKLTAINTCPTYGVLRYAHHKTEVPLTIGGRKLAIEAGKACHDFFAALRMWTLRYQQPQLNEQAWQAHGFKLFGRERWASMQQQPQDADPQTNALNFALDALHTSGYYDDPSDRKRTMSNMEASCINYLTRYFQSDMPVAVKGDLIGVEIPFVLEVTRIHSDGMNEWTTTHYYCGRIDGVHHYGDGLAVAENKTAAQLSSTWRTAFAISNQVTGYTIAGTEIFGEEITNAFVMGTQIPLPRDVYNGVVFEPMSRTVSDRIRWCEWYFESIATYERYVPTPTAAPRYSHSCNRFFSACEFIPYCASAREEQDSILQDMRVEEWSPLDHLDSEGE